MIAVINLKLLLESKFWNLPLVASVVLSIVLYIIFNITLAYLWIPTTVHNVVERMTYYSQENFLSDGVKFNTTYLVTFPMNMQLLRSILELTFRRFF